MKASLPNVPLACPSSTSICMLRIQWISLKASLPNVPLARPSPPHPASMEGWDCHLSPFSELFPLSESLKHLTLMYGNLVKGKLKRYGFMLSSRPLRSDKESFCQRCSSLLTFYEEMNDEYLYFPKKHRKNCECCPRHSLFKGHNVLNCQKCNQCLKVQVSSHKFLGLLSSLIVIVFVIVFVFVLVFLLVMSCLLITLIRFRCLQGHMSLESLFNGVL